MLANTRILLLLSIATFCGFDVAQGQSDIKKTGIQGYGKELSNKQFQCIAILLSSYLYYIE